MTVEETRLHQDDDCELPVTAKPSRDLIMAAHQEITGQWWEHQRAAYDLRVSQFVLDEAGDGDPEAARRLAALQDIPVLAGPARARGGLRRAASGGGGVAGARATWLRPVLADALARHAGLMQRAIDVLMGLRSGKAVSLQLVCLSAALARNRTLTRRVAAINEVLKKETNF